MKYVTVAYIDTSVQGDSAGHMPNQVKRKKLETKDQKINRVKGENIIPEKIKFDLFSEKRNSTKTASKRPITPPNLLGIARKIA